MDTDSIPIQDIHLNKKLHMEGLQQSTMKNLYMLEQ
jgi:hypothetical protein